jgi:hypothetical protein
MDIIKGPINEPETRIEKIFLFTNSTVTTKYVGTFNDTERNNCPAIFLLR